MLDERVVACAGPLGWDLRRGGAFLRGSTRESRGRAVGRWPKKGLYNDSMVRLGSRAHFMWTQTDWFLSLLFFIVTLPVWLLLLDCLVLIGHVYEI